VLILLNNSYSGVSWALSEQPDTIFEVKGWPCTYHNDQNEHQVPTQLDIPSGKWGYEITPTMKPMKWFKLLLLKEADIIPDDIRTSEPLRQARSQLTNFPNLTATELVGRFLRKLWNHTYTELKSGLDVDNIPLKVAITVPAIWPNYAQRATREAARIAGILADRDIGKTTLDLVQEPEAAGLSILFERGANPEIKVCLLHMKEHGCSLTKTSPKAGESFVVCDAGGGTVVSYH
jgi:hypothetical protein